jgi:transcriptional regulator NrdR family protein
MKTTRLNNLAVCPFCASAEIALTEERLPQYGGAVQVMFRVRCLECYATIQRATAADAVEAWNRRVLPEDPEVEAAAERAAEGY